jgi:hypothetical protein
VTEYACANDIYQVNAALSIFIVPPPVVVKSYLVANVVFGKTLAVLAAVVQFWNIIFGTTTFSHVTGTYQALAVPLCHILINQAVEIQHTFALTSVAIVVCEPALG